MSKNKSKTKPEAGIDIGDYLLSISPGTLRRIADEVEKGGIGYLVVVDAGAGTVDRYEVSDFDLEDWSE